MQHVIAMFGATLLVPTITGFPVITTLLFSGVGTVLFLLITGGRIPSYLGSSFAFITPLTASASDGPLRSWAVYSRSGWCWRWSELWCGSWAPGCSTRSCRQS